MNNSTIAIIGAGHMGNSLIGGLIQHGHSPNHLFASDLNEEKLSQLSQSFKIQTTQHNLEAAKAADVIIFATKPNLIKNVAIELASLIKIRKPLVISIAAGIRTTILEHALGQDIAIVRAMPNTPALIGCGASALFANASVTNKQHHLAESILQAVGIVVWIDDEKLMDSITALSGSGPAYFFLMMEALQKAAEKLGLPQEIARLLTLQTGLGATRMAIESDLPLEELRQRVTSPKGTTEKAISVLEEHNIRGLFEKALEAAKKRSEELGNEEIHP